MTHSGRLASGAVAPHNLVSLSLASGSGLGMAPVAREGSYCHAPALPIPVGSTQNTRFKIWLLEQRQLLEPYLSHLGPVAWSLCLAGRDLLLLFVLPLPCMDLTVTVPRQALSGLSKDKHRTKHIESCLLHLILPSPTPMLCLQAQA